MKLRVALGVCIILYASLTVATMALFIKAPAQYSATGAIAFGQQIRSEDVVAREHPWRILAPARDRGPIGMYAKTFIEEGQPVDTTNTQRGPEIRRNGVFYFSIPQSNVRMDPGIPKSARLDLCVLRGPCVRKITVEASPCNPKRTDCVVIFSADSSDEASAVKLLTSSWVLAHRSLRLTRDTP